MKSINIQVFFALLISPLAVFCQSSDFTIQGKIGSQNNGRFVKLYYTNDSTEMVDSVQIQNGRFKFNGDLSAPTVGELSFGKKSTGDRIDLFLSEGTVRVSAKDSLSNAHIRGTKMAKTYEKLAKRIRPMERKVFDGLTAYQGMPEGEAKKAFITALLKDMSVYNHFKLETVLQFAAEYPNSYVSLYYLDDTAQGRLANYETTYPFYEKLSPELKATTLGKQLEQKLMKAKGPFTGKPYIDFASTTPNGEQLRLKDIVNKHEYILLDFWASWCGPCRKENPYVIKTYEAFKDAGFTVLSVSLDDNGEKWKAAIEEDGMPWYHVSSLQGWKEPAAKLYGVRAIPQNMLIDREGKIVASNLRGETLFRKIQALLK